LERQAGPLENREHLIEQVELVRGELLRERPDLRVGALVRLRGGEEPLITLTRATSDRNARSMPAEAASVTPFSAAALTANDPSGPDSVEMTAGVVRSSRASRPSPATRPPPDTDSELRFSNT